MEALETDPKSHAPLGDHDSLFQFRSVSKSFQSKYLSIDAVQDINLSIRPGEFITLVGPSGCGKSTLLSMVAGIFPPTSGAVYYRGKPMQVQHGRVGYMTQNDHLLPWRNVAQNIAVPLEIKNLPGDAIRRRTGELMEFVGLNDFAKSYPSQLSGGMRKRTVLARLLAQDPETLLLDEPFAALDAQLRLRLQIEIRQIATSLKKTVMFVTHDLEEAISLGDRCVVFTARPGTIKRIIEIPLPPGRDLLGLRRDPTYLALTTELWDELAPMIIDKEVR